MADMGIYDMTLAEKIKEWERVDLLNVHEAGILMRTLRIALIEAVDLIQKHKNDVCMGTHGHDFLKEWGFEK